jgi:polyisoprenyl-phosphate glycosyltransferase
MPIKLTIVIPCFNDQDVLPLTYETLMSCLARLVDDKQISDYEMIFVNDGSSDGTDAVLTRLAAANAKVRVILFNANYGHQSAILSGILNSTGDAIVTIDSDLQDPPDRLGDFVAEYKKGNDVVIGIRNDRSVDPFFKRLTAEWFYRVARFLGVPGPMNAGDYRLISRRVKETLKEYPESNLYLRGLIPSMRFPTGHVYYERKARAAGASGYTLSKLLALAADGITSFSIKPLRLIGLVGVVLLLVSVLLIAYVLFLRIVNGIPLEGWTSLFTALLFFQSINLIFFSVLGEYVGKAYMEAKRRPRYVIDRRLNFD